MLKMFFFKNIFHVVQKAEMAESRVNKRRQRSPPIKSSPISSRDCLNKNIAGHLSSIWYLRYRLKCYKNITFPRTEIISFRFCSMWISPNYLPPITCWLANPTRRNYNRKPLKQRLRHFNFST